MLRHLGDVKGAERFDQASTHWLRHSHASHAIAAGMPIEIAQQNLGHASLATTTIYVTDREQAADAGSAEVLGEVRAARPTRAGRGRCQCAGAFPMPLLSGRRRRCATRARRMISTRQLCDRHSILRTWLRKDSSVPVSAVCTAEAVLWLQRASSFSPRNDDSMEATRRRSKRSASSRAQKSLSRVRSTSSHNAPGCIRHEYVKT